MMQKELVATQKQMVIYRDENKEVKGYLIFGMKNGEVHVEEAIY